MKNAFSSLFIGIDPGKTGAMGILDNSGKFIGVFDFVDAAAPLRELSKEIRFAYLEEVHSMPGQGVASTFAFGENYGWWKGVLTAYGIPFRTVRPQDWQKGLVPKKNPGDKPGLYVARQIFPEAPLGRKKDHNRADALLLAKVCHERECV